MTNEVLIESSFATYEIKDGIVYTTIKEGVEIDLEHMDEGIAARDKIQQGSPMLSLTDIRNIYSITNQARSYAAKHERLQQLTTASAILSSTLATKLFANFFVKFDQPKYPTKIFTDKKNAIAWLETFR